MDVDPAASMRCWAVDVEIGGALYTVPPLPAADWWPILAEGNVTGLLDLIDNKDLDRALLVGELSLADAHEALIDAIEAAGGRSLHACLVLAAVAGAQWPVINGQMVMAGFRWDAQPLGAALDAIYHIVTSGLPEKTKDEKTGAETRPREKFLQLLDNEALTTGTKSARQQEKVLGEFAAMAGPKPTGGVRATAPRSAGERPRSRPRSQQPHQDAP